jgi:hypothetical protein
VNDERKGIFTAAPLARSAEQSRCGGEVDRQRSGRTGSARLGSYDAGRGAAIKWSILDHFEDAKWSIVDTRGSLLSCFLIFNLRGAHRVGRQWCTSAHNLMILMRRGGLVLSVWGRLRLRQSDNLTTIIVRCAGNWVAA